VSGAITEAVCIAAMLLEAMGHNRIRCVRQVGYPTCLTHLIRVGGGGGPVQSHEVEWAGLGGVKGNWMLLLHTSFSACAYLQWRHHQC
jgi:hypothetical protein